MSDTPLAERVNSVAQWYHTLELAPGVVTPGWFDLRGAAADLPFPDDLAGQRCLDVGTFDGFWAFEMEKRGAAEVVAVDLLDPEDWDWPHGSEEAVVEAVGRRKSGGSGFEIARDALGSAVDRREMSVYDLDPVTLGTFDFVYVGSLLLHLRDPVRALERVRAVCAREVLVVDAIDATLSAVLPNRPVAALDGRGRPWWWKPNVAGLKRMVESAGFDVIGAPVRTRLRLGASQPAAPIRPSVLRTREGREQLVLSRFGDPHAAIRGRPR